MGAKRRTDGHVGDGSKRPVNVDGLGYLNASSRNLRKGDLAGVIFGCKHNTISECLTKQLFGLPGPHISYVRNIEPGLLLFLFNYSDRKLHGIYESASHGQMNIDPYAWTNNGKERTSYPAQVRIRFKMYCQPLVEAQFKPIIDDNYHTSHHFLFELDHTQLNGLLSLFKPTQPIVNTIMASGSSSSCDLFKRLPAERKEAESLLNDVNDHRYQERTLFAPTKEWRSKERVTYCGDLVDDRVPVVPSNNNYDYNEGKKSGREDLERVLSKLKKLSNECDSLDQLSRDSPVSSSTLPFSEMAAEVDEQIPEASDVLCRDNILASDPHPDNNELIRMVKELQERSIFLEKKQIESEKELQQLRNIARESTWKVQQLTEHVKELESRLDPSLRLVNKSLNESLVQLYPGSEKLVYLIGGYDGNSWLSALDSYSPSLDIMTPLHPMVSARSYASATALNGCLYVFGGGDGSLWYDTVECYNPRIDEWITCPSLVREKGSLAGATLNDKIFAIGGGDGRESFSDAEMFDPALGRWINSQSMIQKRFALAAVELGGALYAVGGFNGLNYLKSAERFDPREGYWARIPSMNVPRGCHSMTVLNGKVYAMGGYDGEEMVPSVEVFDPRGGAWVTGSSMSKIRGYAAAAVLGESLYVIGGVSDGKTIVDTVECYREDAGWMIADLKGVGRRCFFSAIVL